MKRLMTAICALAVLAGGEVSAQLKADDIRKFSNDPYTGEVEAGVFDAKGGRHLDTSGPAEAELKLLPGGRLELALTGAIKTAGDAGITATLAPDGKGGWADTGHTLKMFISPEGVISGRDVIGNTEQTLSGQVTDEALTLKVRSTVLSGMANGLPAGASMQYEFDLQRKRLAQTRQASTGDDEKCDRIVMQARNIANPGGGAMQMIMVPVCMDVKDKK